MNLLSDIVAEQKEQETNVVSVFAFFLEFVIKCSKKESIFLVFAGVVYEIK